MWVHGFHLLLLPSFLTRVLRTARVGLFLHTPFPSSEIFRTLPFREDLLRGMLNADQVTGALVLCGCACACLARCELGVYSRLCCLYRAVGANTFPERDHCCCSFVSLSFECFARGGCGYYSS